MRQAFATLTIALLLLVPQAGLASGSSDARARQLAAQIESPFCPGQTLTSCTSPSAAVWREDIRRWVDQDVDSNTIKARLSERAGRDLSTVPSTIGTRWLLGLAALGSLAGFFAVARRSARRNANPERPAEPTDDEDNGAADARLDEELALLDA